VNDVLREIGLGPADVAISGIPFSMMTEESRRSVLKNTYEALKKGGSFIVYQFSARVKTDLEELFGPVRQQFEPRNILPARVFHCIKK
jgi:phospholipid N-methyltransferase